MIVGVLDNLGAQGLGTGDPLDWERQAAYLRTSVTDARHTYVAVPVFPSTLKPFADALPDSRRTSRWAPIRDELIPDTIRRSSARTTPARGPGQNEVAACGNAQRSCSRARPALASVRPPRVTTARRFTQASSRYGCDGSEREPSRTRSVRLPRTDVRARPPEPESVTKLARLERSRSSEVPRTKLIRSPESKVSRADALSAATRYRVAASAEPASTSAARKATPTRIARDGSCCNERPSRPRDKRYVVEDSPRSREIIEETPRILGRRLA